MLVLFQTACSLREYPIEYESKEFLSQRIYSIEFLSPKLILKDPQVRCRLSLSFKNKHLDQPLLTPYNFFIVDGQMDGGMDG